MSKRLLVACLALALTMGQVPFALAESAPAAVEPDGGAIAAAVVSDLVYVPGKVATCVTSGALWTVVMLVTAGTYYKEAGDVVHSACTGRWALTGEDMMAKSEK